MYTGIKLFSGNSNIKLAGEIAKVVKMPLSKIEATKFSDGEIRIRLHETVRGADVFLIQSTCKPVNENLMELLLMIDAAKRASAGRITAIIPYFGYARQDRKDRPRVPISAKLVANLLEAAGADRILTMDLHADQIQGFFDIPLDHLYGAVALLDQVKKRISKEKVVIVSPDAGGVERARRFAKCLKASLAIIDKRRPKPNHSEVMNIIGEVKGRVCILIDDMIDTGGTIVKAAAALKNNGAKKVFACASHGVFSKNAIENLNNSCLEKVFITNTIPVETQYKKFEVVSIAKLIGKAIITIHEMKSIQELFSVKIPGKKHSPYSLL